MRSIFQSTAVVLLLLVSVAGCRRLDRDRPATVDTPASPARTTAATPPPPPISTETKFDAEQQAMIDAERLGEQLDAIDELVEHIDIHRAWTRTGEESAYGDDEESAKAWGEFIREFYVRHNSLNDRIVKEYPLSLRLRLAETLGNVQLMVFGMISKNRNEVAEFDERYDTQRAELMDLIQQQRDEIDQP